MGLDQFAWAKKRDYSPDGTKYTEEGELIMQWRKHANLEGWMRDLYKEKGGDENKFNQKDLELDHVDLKELNKTHRNLKTAKGFFWGESQEEDINNTQKFIDKATKLLDSGYRIVYNSWW